MSKTKVAVFASGTGSNFEALMDKVELESLDYCVALLVCDKPGALVLNKAAKYQVPVFVFDPKQYNFKSEFEQKIVKELQNRHIDWIVLAGYMRLIGPTLLTPFQSKIINIHPSLLPSFPGKDAVGQALATGVKVTGVTIHFVDEGMDTGKIIEQESLRIHEKESRESLQQRLQSIEHRLFPKIIQSLISSDNKEGAFLNEKESTT
ncbi:phosphoribosylglycinamide formyltransferase [Aquibacillus halophilus]|uniref:Phosphoribosylglycinamide formyltransferase n=1 Tax=Aquibacillus halophilus TaxID=930132 RepID=A0A6A8DGW8_9BACI|nr:phosphoribosylglycinamide formyltransferase [Aquibacillus halophilus]MRH44913.1 phosphoribosylglycinamide formyltransferase [Aquibacillus halophilus]